MHNPFFGNFKKISFKISRIVTELKNQSRYENKEDIWNISFLFQNKLAIYACEDGMKVNSTFGDGAMVLNCENNAYNATPEFETCLSGKINIVRARPPFKHQ